MDEGRRGEWRGRAYLEYHGDGVALLELVAREELVQEARAGLPPVARKVEVEVIIERGRQRRGLDALCRRRCSGPLCVPGARGFRVIFRRCSKSGGILVVILVLVLVAFVLPPVQLRRILRYPNPLVPH